MPTNRTLDFIGRVKKAGVYCFDVEHNPEFTWSQPGFRLTGVGFATDGMEFFERDQDEACFIIQTLFKVDELEAVGYNVKYDLKCLVAVGWIESKHYPKGLVDPMIGVNLLDENRNPGEMGLKRVVYDKYGYEMMHFPDAWAFGEHSKEFTDYAVDDARWELRLHLDLRPKLKDQGLWKLFRKILMPASMVFADVELAGVGWDIDGARGLLRGFQLLRRQMEREIKENIGDLNLASGDQVARRLFDELGYSTCGLEMTDSKKRYSTNAQAMEKLAKKYPVCDKIVKWRTATKMISTYIEPLTRMALVDPNERIHPTFWLISTTGRTRCEKPNFQNIPAWLDKMFSHLNIRKNIICRPGWKMIVADYSQLELRICGHISQDREFLRAYREWQCTGCGERGSANTILHECPKCGLSEDEDVLTDKLVSGFWHGLDLHQMTADGVPALKGSRQNGKKSNFALIFYATAGRMAYEYPELSMRQWQEVIDQYFQKYFGVRQQHVIAEREIYRTGVCRSVFGRKRRIPKVVLRQNPKHALNMFINFPVQASACELVELSMAKLRERWIASGDWMKNIIQSNMVHDEGCWECPGDQVDRFVLDIQEVMENAVQFRVPMRADILVVDRWGDAKN